MKLATVTRSAPRQAVLAAPHSTSNFLRFAIGASEKCASESHGHVFESLHLLSMSIHDTLHLLSVQGIAPFIGTSGTEKSCLFAHGLHEPVLLFQR